MGWVGLVARSSGRVRKRLFMSLTCRFRGVESVKCWYFWTPCYGTRRSYRVHKTPLFAPVLSQMNPFHTILLYLFKIYFNIVLFMPGLHSRVFISDCPTRPRIHFSSLPYTPRECRTDLLLKWVVDVHGCGLPCLAQGRMLCRACFD
jgi:hypothetical protein